MFVEVDIGSDGGGDVAANSSTRPANSAPIADTCFSMSPDGVTLSPDGIAISVERFFRNATVRTQRSHPVLRARFSPVNIRHSRRRLGRYRRRRSAPQCDPPLSAEA
jgi:hypothetical protein